MFNCDSSGLYQPMTQYGDWSTQYLQYYGVGAWGEQPWQPWGRVLGLEDQGQLRGVEDVKPVLTMYQDAHASQTEISQQQSGTYSGSSSDDQPMQRQLETQSSHFNPLVVSVQSIDKTCNISPNPQEVPSTPSPVSSESSSNLSDISEGHPQPMLPMTQYDPLNYDPTRSYFEIPTQQVEKRRKQSQSSLYSYDSTYSSESGQSSAYASDQNTASASHSYFYPSSASPPSSPESDDSVFGPANNENPLAQQTQQPKFELPPINLKNNQSFTEAEIKAITPWRNQLIERLLNNRSISQNPQPQFKQSYPAMETNQQPQNLFHSVAPNQNLFLAQKTPARLTMYHRAAGPKTKQARNLKPGTQIFQDVGHLVEFDFGDGCDFDGKIRRGTTGFMAISGAMTQVNQGAGTVRAVVETILKYCLPRNLSEYSLTGKSLQEKLEIRNGQAQSRVVMSESGSTKHGVPAELISGLVTFLKLFLTEAGVSSSGSPTLASYARKLISKTCSRSQEKKNHEVKSSTIKGKKLKPT